MQYMYIESVSEYLRIIESLSEKYPCFTMLNNTAGNKFLYRGEDNVSLKVLPGIFRQEKIEMEEGGNIENLKYLACAHELYILKHFMQEAVSYSNIPIDDLGKWLELAQHHGVPTRLLDWTSNPLVALYFACYQTSNADARVWLLHRINYNIWARKKEDYITKNPKEIISELLNEQSNKKLPFIYKPYYFDLRMSCQSSYFMVWGTNIAPFEDMLNEDCYMRHDCQNDVMITTNIKDSDQFVFQILIKETHKQRIIRQLDNLGINSKTLFPGIDGIGKYIERKFRFDYQEACDNF